MKNVVRRKESSTIFERITGEITQKFSIREEYDVI